MSFLTCRNRIAATMVVLLFCSASLLQAMTIGYVVSGGKNGNPPLDPFDLGWTNHLINVLGHDVTVMFDNDGSLQNTVEVLIISSDVGSGNVVGAYNLSTAQPILTGEYGLYDDFGLTVDGDPYAVTGPLTMTIENSWHPLAAGLSGEVVVYSTDSTTAVADDPVADAMVRIGPCPRADDGLTIGVLEPGAPNIDGVPAPGRRIISHAYDLNAFNTLTADGLALLDAQVAYMLAPTAVEPPFAVSAFAVESGTDAIVTWPSEAYEREYTLQWTPDVVLANWTNLPPFTNMLAVSSSITVTSPISGALANYRVVESPLTPIFFDDLESGAVGWTTNTVAGSTDWELGTPNYTGTRGAFTNAYSGTNAWATGLTNAYAQGDNTKLRTPMIDLAGLSGAVLRFYELTDIEDDYDFGWVNILDPNDLEGTPLATNLYAANGTSTSWTQQEVTLNDFTNQQIVIEFELWEDGLQFEDWYGWAIDDISVVVGPPTPPPPPPFTNSVIGLILVDSSGTNNATPVDLVAITEGASLDLDTIGAGGTKVANTNLNVRAEVDGVVGSVTFALTGATTQNQTESQAAYYLFGNNGDDVTDGTFNAGAHTLVATPWDAAGGGGQAGTNLTVNFTVTFTP